MFLQDGDPSQNFALARAAMERTDSTVIKLRARSPDLAVIENVFSMVGRMVKRQVLQQQLRRETFEQFKNRVINKFQSIPVETVHNLIGSMPKRIDRVITRTTKCILWITARDFSQIVAFRDKITIAQFAKIRGGGCIFQNRWNENCSDGYEDDVWRILQSGMIFFGRHFTKLIRYSW